MTEQEALKFMILFRNEWDVNSKTKNAMALDIAIKALEKQIEKKTTHEATIHACNTCPGCKNVLDRFEYIGGKKCLITTRHCCFCGQKLDWSDV